MRLLVLLASMCFTSFLNAYPIDPCPLRYLVEKAPIIAYGKVINIEEHPGEYGGYQNALLDLSEVLKGERNLDKIKIRFNRAIVCPEPARYEAGKKYLVFVWLDSTIGIYRTHSLSYGCKNLDKAAFEIYKKRITEYQHIRKYTNTKLKEHLTFKWLVHCSLEQATRWEGLSELSSYSDFMKKYNPDKKAVKDVFGKVIRKKMRNALLNTGNPNMYDFKLLDFIQPEEDPELNAFLICYVTTKKSTFYIFRKSLLHTIAELTDHDRLKRIMEKIWPLKPYNKEDRIQLNKLQKDFISILKNSGRCMMEFQKK